MSLTSIQIASTPTTIATVRPTAANSNYIDAQFVNDDPSQTIDVTITKTFHAGLEAPVSDNQFTGILPGECRVGRVEYPGRGAEFTFKGQASGAGNATLRYWTST